MKKTLIVSLILILAAGGIFGFSLYNYIGSTKKDVATVDQSSTSSGVVETQAAETTAAPLSMPADWNDNGIFSSYYDKAYQRVMEMSNEELVGSVIMGVCEYDDDNALTDVTKYKLGAYLMEPACFSGVNETEIKEMIKKYKQRYDGFFIAVDEEGGSNTTVTDHNAFTEYSFDAVGDIYREGGITEVQKMERDKLAILKECGITLNLAPVVDLATDTNQIMYTRSLGADAATTSEYARYVTSTFQGEGVSVCLRHFPGYGTIEDTYETPVTDTRLLSDIQAADYLPFKAGIEEKCHFIMVSNVLVQCLDPNNVASLSSGVHNALRKDLGFSGLIISDNLDDLSSGYDETSPDYVKAITAGNDMIIVSDYANAFDTILQALQNGNLEAETLQKAASRVLAYKYTVGLLKDKKMG